MKLRVVVGILSLSILGTWACEEQQGESSAEQKKAEETQKAGEPKAGENKDAAKAEPAAEAPKTPEVSPKQVCEEAQAAAKAKDEAKLTTYVSGDLAPEGAKETLTAFLDKGTCGEPKVDGDKGQVPLTMGAGKKAKTKELPVVKAADGWKIDAATFIEKNPPKKAKVKKGGKAKKTK